MKKLLRIDSPRNLPTKAYSCVVLPIITEVTLFYYESAAFSFKLIAQRQINNGVCRVVPYVPDPVSVYAAMDRLYNELTLDSLHYFGCVEFHLHGAQVCYDVKKNESYVVWPRTWLSSYHAFRKAYDNFVKSFNSNNFIIE